MITKKCVYISWTRVANNSVYSCFWHQRDFSFFSFLLQQKNCTVAIVDDLDFEPDEEFYLRLADPMTEDGLTAQLGDIDVVTVTITNHDDGQSSAVFLF